MSTDAPTAVVCRNNWPGPLCLATHGDIPEPWHYCCLPEGHEEDGPIPRPCRCRCNETDWSTR